MIEVSVFANHSDWNEKRCALRKRIDFENDVKVDCKSIVDSMRCLFGNSCVVDFVFLL